jgi:hypothetical protein
MAAGGMGRGSDRLRSPLSERGHRPPDADAGGAEGRPCWLLVESGRAPGSVLAWRRAGNGEWEALVLAWLPRGDVAERRQTR